MKNPSKWLMLRGNHEARDTNGYVEYYGEGCFQNLCLKAETAARLLPRELWFEFNAVFDYLPLAAVGTPLSLSSATLSLSSHHRRTRSFKARSLRFMEVCPADQLGTTYAQVQPRGLLSLHASSQRCVADAAAGADSPPARAPVEALLETLPRPWDGENPRDGRELARTAGCVFPDPLPLPLPPFLWNAACQKGCARHSTLFLTDAFIPAVTTCFGLTRYKAG